MGKSQRVKGHTFERDIASRFRDAGFEHARTSRQVSRIADDCKIDIVGVFPYAPQCKRLGKRYASINEVQTIDWQKYAAANSDDRTFIPILITKSDNEPSMVALPLDAFMNLIRKSNG